MILEALARASTGSIIDGEGRIGLDPLLSRSRALAAYLRARGVRRVGVMASPARRFVIALLGVMWSGATAVVLSPLHPRAEIEAAIARARIELVIEDLDGLTAFGDPEYPAADADGLILFTSGTTAAPKAARLTHGNLYAHSRVLHDAWRWSQDDVLLHALPLHHLHGLGTAMLTALSAGATCELLPRFDPQLVLDAAPRCTVWMAVPTTIARVLDKLPGIPGGLSPALSGLRLVTNGSAALPRVHAERFRDVAGDYPLERFGMTEVGVVTSQPIDGPRVPGVAGRAVPGMDVRIVDDEIQVRGAGVFPGYDDEEATRASFVDGWFRTGDSGELHDGQLVVRGRLSVDVLKSAGYKLSALEIEHAIREYPSVTDVAVVGVPDDEWGDLVAAVIVGDVDVDALRSFLRERLAPYKIPKRFVKTDALPRNSIGKVTKPELVRSLTTRPGPER